MELFPSELSAEHNLLPVDGEVYYYGSVYDTGGADSLLKILQETITWRQDEVVLFGKHIVTRRLTAWYGDRGLSYSYSNIARVALPWTDELLHIKQRVEVLTGETYNSCLLNLYHDGSEAMGWHSDNEKELQPNGAIASVSFGAARQFVFRHRITKDKVLVLLAHGSLLVMKGATQAHWQHQLPATAKVKTPRVNLTFRTIVG